jgi:protein pelota
MIILSENFKKGTVQLKIENKEDLWHLSQIIESGDFIKGKTTRKIKIGQGENVKTVKKTYLLSISTEQVELSELGDILKINGKVIEDIEDIPKGSYQSISLSEQDEFKLTKQQWYSYQKERLEETAQKKHDYLILLFDRENALFVKTNPAGFETIAKINADSAKKFMEHNVQKDFYEELNLLLEQYNQKISPKSIIIGSPSFYKEYLVNKISSSLAKKIIFTTCSTPNKSALNEIMKKKEINILLADNRTALEINLIDDLLREINQNGKAVYGLKEFEKAINFGAVEKMLISTKFIQNKRSKNEFEKIETIMKNIDSLNGKIHIINSDNEAGQKLDGLSGIAGLLRFKID